MEVYERLAILAAMRKKVDAAYKSAQTEADAEIKAMGAGVTKVTTSVGGERVDITVPINRPKPWPPEDRRSPFWEFMRDHGMTEETLAPGWDKRVVRAGDAMVWEETGEVVPDGAWLPESMGTARPTVRDADAVLREASRLGLLSAEMPMLGGGAE